VDALTFGTSLKGEKANSSARVAEKNWESWEWIIERWNHGSDAQMTTYSRVRFSVSDALDVMKSSTWKQPI